MRISRSAIVPALIGGLLVTALQPTLAQSGPLRLLGAFEDSWRTKWMERKLSRRKTDYQVVREGENLVLRAESRNSASGLWHTLKIRTGEVGKLSWRWKISNSLSKNRAERAKQGDDYAARVFVVFEPRFFLWKTRSICYVWAAHEKIGSIYGNPRAGSVATIVLRSGDARSGEWVAEERDFIADYKSYFGVSPQMLSAVAVMTDTDDSGLEATAWFDDITLDPGRRAADQ